MKLKVLWLFSMERTAGAWIGVCEFSPRNDIMFFKDPFNVLKPTGHVMHQQFNIQQF